MSKRIRFFTAYLLHYLRQYALVMILGIIAGSLIYIERNKLVDLYHYVFIPTQSIGIEGLYTQQNLPPKIANLISHGITTITENDKATLSPLIEKVENQENYLSYTFIFKDDLYWQNGKKFKTSDIDLNIPGTTITKKNSQSLTIDLTDSYSPLYSVLSRPLFLKKTLIGLGGHIVENATYQDGYLKTLKLSNTNTRNRIEYHFYSNNTDLYNAFKLGEVDEISTNTLDDQFNSWPNIKITPSISTNQYLAIFLNTKKLSSKQLRQSISYATPKSDDKNKRCLSPVSPTSWAYNPQVKPYNYNPTRAKELLEKDHPATLNLAITDRQLLTMAEIIKKSWQDILGIKTEISILSQNPNFEDYDAFLTYGLIPTDPDQYAFWHSTQNQTNITHLSNSRIDKLLEEGRLIQDPLERKKTYYDFQRYLLEESPAIFLEFPTTYLISRLK